MLPHDPARYKAIARVSEGGRFLVGGSYVLIGGVSAEGVKLPDEGGEGDAAQCERGRNRTHTQKYDA